MKLQSAALIPLLLLLISQYYDTASADSACPDEYMYTQQPPDDSVCSPYVNSVLQLICTITGPDLEQIHWYYSEDIDSDEKMLLVNSTKYTLIPMDHENGLTLALTVHTLNESDIGVYWCQASISDSESLLSASNYFTLYDSEYYGFDIPCQNYLRNSDILCASPLEIPSEEDLPTTSVSPTQALTSSLLPTVLPTSLPPEPPTTRSPPGDSLSPSSEIILYVVLGLVGFLAVVCIALAFVIMVLCKRRCRRIGLEGSQCKEAGFDHLSNQSALSLASKQHAVHTPYQPDVSMQITVSHSRNVSGDYAEIGPALFSGGGGGGGGAHNYSEIPEYLQQAVLQHAVQQEAQMCYRSTEMDPYLTPRLENPYDLPIPPQTLPSPATCPVDSTDGQQHTLQSSHGYHVLERAVPDSELATGFKDHSETSETSSSILTPPSTPPPPPPLPAEETPQTLHDSSTSQATMEHPYHVLEQQEFAPTSRGLENPQRRSVKKGEVAQEYTQPRIAVLASSPPKLGLSTGYDRLAERSDQQAYDRLAEISEDNDQEYDRLVGPPHLYHILDHHSSPTTANRPRIIEMPGYGRLQGMRPMQQQQHQHQHSPSHLTLTSDEATFSSKSDFLSSSESSQEDVSLFDDPQYTHTEPHDAGAVAARVSPQDEEVAAIIDRLSCERNEAERRNSSEEGIEEEVSLSKYRGDYERDPLYMHQLKRKASPTDTTQDSGFSRDDSDCGFSSTLPICRKPLRPGSISAPPHVYQSLESTTIQPPQPYENVRKDSPLSEESSF